jgi:hypothetical protein
LFVHPLYTQAGFFLHIFFESNEGTPIIKNFQGSFLFKMITVAAVKNGRNITTNNWERKAIVLIFLLQGPTQ